MLARSSTLRMCAGPHAASAVGALTTRAHPELSCGAGRPASAEALRVTKAYDSGSAIVPSTTACRWPGINYVVVALGAGYALARIWFVVNDTGLKGELAERLRRTIPQLGAGGLSPGEDPGVESSQDPAAHCSPYRHAALLLQRAHLFRPEPAAVDMSEAGRAKRKALANKLAQMAAATSGSESLNDLAPAEHRHPFRAGIHGNPGAVIHGPLSTLDPQMDPRDKLRALETCWFDPEASWMDGCAPHCTAAPVCSCLV